MISPDSLRSLAREMKSAQDSARQIEPFTDRVPGFDLEAAYRVSRLIHEARIAEGAKPVGRKIGFTNPGMWSIYGVKEPVWAHVYDTTVVRRDGARAACSLARFAEPKIEPEIVLHFRSPPPPGGDVRAILDCIDWVAHGLEIVQSHFPGWRFRAPDTVADWGLHATLLVGPPQPVEAIAPDPVTALERFTLHLHRDGAHIETGRGSNVLSNPLAAIAHLLEVLAKQPDAEPLGSGELVTTGTVTTAHPLRPGENWDTRIEGIALPGLELRALP